MGVSVAWQCGVRRTKSKFGARLEPGSHVDIQLYTGKTFDTVTQVEALMNYGEALTEDYRAAGQLPQAIPEAAERFTSQANRTRLTRVSISCGRNEGSGGKSLRAIVDSGCIFIAVTCCCRVRTIDDDLFSM
jgi:hypothetical protein